MIIRSVLITNIINVIVVYTISLIRNITTLKTNNKDQEKIIGQHQEQITGKRKSGKASEDKGIDTKKQRQENRNKGKGIGKRGKKYEKGKALAKITFMLLISKSSFF